MESTATIETIETSTILGEGVLSGRKSAKFQKLG